MKDLIERLRDWDNTSSERNRKDMKEAADLLERIYAQPVELPRTVKIFENDDHIVVAYTANQLTQAVQEATARALEAAANEADTWQSAIHDPRYECDCATAIRNLIGRVK